MRRKASFVLAMVLGLTIFLMLLPSQAVQAAGLVYYVDDDNCPGPGTGTQVDPFCSIQSGIDAASSGDTVQVAAGTYYENITMKSGVVIQGAGQGVSIIDGGGSGTVVTAISVDSAATLDGFTITNGLGDFGGGMYNNNASPTVTNCTFAENWSNYDGGGMQNGSSSPIVTNCTFAGNTANYHGGGMYNFDNSSPTVTNCTFSGNISSDNGGGMYNQYSSSPTVTNCTFSANTADYGGGMSNTNDSSPTVTNCTFAENSANYDGGGMQNGSSSPIVTNCTFAGNTANYHGGGMQNTASSPTVTNCTFIGNTVSNYYGGGMYNSDNSSPIMTNCTFSGNSASSGGGGIRNFVSSSPTLTNCILWGDSPEEILNSSATPSVTYSNIQGGYTGTGNINADPLFVDGANGDLHLKPLSPCIDAGDNSAPSLPSTDFEGDDRRIDDPTVIDTGNGTSPIVDMGADEFEPVVADFTVTTTSGEEPLNIDFTDQSTGTITSWDWDFGDGATSTEQNPSHTYQDFGTFTVSLTVSRPGATDTETKVDLINVEPLDSDDDGLPDYVEDTTCSDSLDADSDDDGILDGEEDLNKNGLVDPGETNPCNGDTDGDGIQDGTELGLTLDDIGPDTNTDIFQPDLDPATTTDPLNPDSDNDGTTDGDEDGNHNGRVDQGERNPNVPDGGLFHVIPNKTGGATVIYLE